MSDPRDDLSTFERSLSGLAPRRGVDRDRLMYEAGRHAGRRDTRGWRWPAFAAALALTTIGQGVALSRRPMERVVERIVAIPAPAADPVVILTRREPAAIRGADADPPRFSSLAARTGLTATEPPLLSAAYLGPLDVPTVELMSPLHGRVSGLRTIPGGPL